MIIRLYNPKDDKDIIKLFFDTVHTVNAKDYTKAQLAVWAPNSIKIDKWCEAFKTDYTLVAVEENIIVGFANMDRSGCLDRLYVHKDYQKKGVATKLVSVLEKYAAKNDLTKIYSYVSITAKPFFEKMGYSVISENIVERGGQSLLNYKMIKKYKKTV